MAYLFITRELRVEDQALNILKSLSLRMRCLLTPLDTEDHLAHDLELFPVDAGFVLAHEGFVTFFCGDQVAAVKREEWNSFRE